MERYFLGNNTAYGFKGYYEDELKNKSKVILLKGGPGTGKSSILKKLAAEAKKRGYDYELWYCSGDPQSLDGVFIKDTGVAIVDATAPHASGADLPKIKDYIFDLATSLSHDKLTPERERIEKLLNDKKRCFIRAYQHLKVALCHLHNQLELEMTDLKQTNIRAYASVVASNLRCTAKSAGRKLFTQAICPVGESVYYDHLRDKRIFKVDGGLASRKIFFDELKGLLDGATLILDPLEPEIVDGIIVGDAAVVSDVGHFANGVSESINLYVYENSPETAAIEEEKNSVTTHIALAEDCLENARRNHLGAEKYFIEAMDFDRNGKIYADIVKEIF